MESEKDQHDDSDCSSATFLRDLISACINPCYQISDIHGWTNETPSVHIEDPANPREETKSCWAEISSDWLSYVEKCDEISELFLTFSLSCQTETCIREGFFLHKCAHDVWFVRKTRSCEEFLLNDDADIRTELPCETETKHLLVTHCNCKSSRWHQGVIISLDDHHCCRAVCFSCLIHHRNHKVRRSHCADTPCWLRCGTDLWSTCLSWRESDRSCSIVLCDWSSSPMWLHPQFLSRCFTMLNLRSTSSWSHVRCRFQNSRDPWFISQNTHCVVTWRELLSSIASCDRDQQVRCLWERRSGHITVLVEHRRRSKRWRRHGQDWEHEPTQRLTDGRERTRQACTRLQKFPDILRDEFRIRDWDFDCHSGDREGFFGDAADELDRVQGCVTSDES